jgi:hypothetical protein
MIFGNGVDDEDGDDAEDDGDGDDDGDDDDDDNDDDDSVGTSPPPAVLVINLISCCYSLFWEVLPSRGSRGRRKAERLPGAGSCPLLICSDG